MRRVSVDVGGLVGRSLDCSDPVIVGMIVKKEVEGSDVGIEEGNVTE